jgi:hypothetical protein
VGDGRHENDGKESADIEDEKLFLECPGKGEEEENADRKEDVAADGGAGSLLVRSEFVGCWLGQRESPV